MGRVGHGERTTQKKSIPVSIPARLGPAMSNNPSEPILYQSCYYIRLIRMSYLCHSLHLHDSVATLCDGLGWVWVWTHNIQSQPI